MSQDYFALLIDLAKIIQEPNIEKTMKEKAIKDILKQGVNISPNYGSRTKQDLKALIDSQLSEKELFEAICAYLSTNDTNN